METQTANPRRLRLFLRDFRMVEASANMADGQTLSVARRRSFAVSPPAECVESRNVTVRQRMSMSG